MRGGKQDNNSFPHSYAEHHRRWTLPPSSSFSCTPSVPSRASLPSLTDMVTCLDEGECMVYVDMGPAEPKFWLDERPDAKEWEKQHDAWFAEPEEQTADPETDMEMRGHAVLSRTIACYQAADFPGEGKDGRQSTAPIMDEDDDEEEDGLMSAGLVLSKVPPGDITTQPGTKIVFNAPHDHKHTYHIKVTNSSKRRVAFRAMGPTGVPLSPVGGSLAPFDLVMISAEVTSEGCKDDHVTIEWTNTPRERRFHYDSSWFDGNALVRRKKIPVVWNK